MCQVWTEPEPTIGTPRPAFIPGAAGRAPPQPASLAQTARTCIYGHFEECNANDPAVSHLKMDGLELGKDAEHVKERLAGSGRGVHGLVGGGEMGALVLEGRDNDLEITHRARQAVDTRDHQRLAGMDESRMVRSSGRPARVAPSPVSVRTMVQPAARGHRKVCSLDYSKDQIGLLERLDASSAVGEQVFHAVIALAHFERRHLLE